MTRRLGWIAGLALLFGCGGLLPFEPSLFDVRTDQSSYTDTSTVVVTIKLNGGASVGLEGCPPPAVIIADSTAPGSLGPTATSLGFFCNEGVPRSQVRLDAGDSVAVGIPLTGVAPGTYRAVVEFGPAGERPTWVTVSKAFQVH